MKIGKRPLRQETVDRAWIGVVGQKPVPIKLETAITLRAGETLTLDLTANDLFTMIDHGGAFRAELEAFDEEINTQANPFDTNSDPLTITGEDDTE